MDIYRSMYVYSYMCVRCVHLASRFHLSLFFLCLSFSRCRQYVRVLTSMINHIVLYIEYKLAIITAMLVCVCVRTDRTEESTVRQNEHKGPASGLLFLLYFSSFSVFVSLFLLYIINERRTVVALIQNVSVQ